MVKWLVVVMVLWVCVAFGELSQTEISILKYQLQMPQVIGNAVGFRLLGSGINGAVGMFGVLISGVCCLLVR